MAVDPGRKPCSTCGMVMWAGGVCYYCEQVRRDTEEKETQARQRAEEVEKEREHYRRELIKAALSGAVLEYSKPEGMANAAIEIADAVLKQLEGEK